MIRATKNGHVIEAGNVAVEGEPERWEISLDGIRFFATHDRITFRSFMLQLMLALNADFSNASPPPLS